MTSANLQNWYYVELTLKTKAAGTSSTVNLINRAALNATVGSYWPILRSISSVGSRMGEYLPQTFTGTIVVDNRPGTFGFERRFSDVLERNTIIDQSVKIYSAHVPADTDPYSSWALAYVARAASWSLGDSGETLSITIDSQTIAKRTVTRPIESNTFSSAPNSALGQHLPLVIGTNIEVKPLRISADSAATLTLAYATTLGAQYVVGGVQAYYVKGSAGRYVQVASPASTSTALFDDTTNAPTQGSIAYNENGYELNQETSGYIVRGGTLQLIGNGAGGGPVSGYLIIKLLDASPVAGPGENVLATAKLDKANYAASWYSLFSEFTVEWAFDKPVALSANTTYWLAVSGTNETAGSLTKIGTRNGSKTPWSRYTGSSTDNDAAWKPGTASVQDSIEVSLYGLKFTDFTGVTGGVNLEGLGHAYVEVTQKTAPTGFTNPDLTNLDFVFSINGLLDDTSGTVTGSASSQITSPQHAIELLDKEWNGSTWTGGRLDNSKFSATHSAVNTTTHTYYRKIGGRTEGRTFLADLYNEICYNTRLRIALVNSSTNPLAIWVWGTEVASSATITDEDSVILGAQQAGVETITNRLQMFYDKRIKEVDIVAGSAEGEFRSYAKQIDWTYLTNSLSTALATISNTLYGSRSLKKSNFDWLNDTDSGETIAEYFLRVFALPHWFVTVEVPFIKYKTLDMLDVITLVHPDLPAYFGTSAQSKIPTYAGTGVDIAQGFYPKRANSYRAQIEARELDLFDQQFPKLRLTARILDNYPTDPT